jgi:hypothetical protein
MNTTKQIASYLYEWAKESKNEFIEIAVDSELIKVAEKMNLVIPSPDIAILKTTYAQTDVANRNGVVLKKEDVEKGLPTLIGKQCNWSHRGAYHVCGWILDAKLEKDLIIVYAAIYKSLFIEEFSKVKDLFEKNKLSVSFEIWNKTESGETAVHSFTDNTVYISPIIFHGMGILIEEDEKPACPKAYAQKLLAIFNNKTISEAEKIVEKIFEPELIFASLAVHKPICSQCGTCHCEEVDKVDELFIESDYEGGEIEEAKKLTTEQRNALPDSDFALIQEKDGKKIRRFPINDEAHVRNALARLPQAKDLTEEERAEALKNILKRAKELNMEEIVKKYEKAEEIVSVEEPTSTTEATEEPKTEKTPAETKTTTEPVVAETNAEETPNVEETQQAQVVEQPINPVVLLKTTLEETYITVEEAPVDGVCKTHKKGLKRRTMSYSDGRNEVFEEEFEIVDRYTMAQLEEAVNTVRVEKDNEIATLKTTIESQKTELGQKDQEIEKLTPKVEKKKEIIMTVGAVAVDVESKKITDEITRLAFPQPKE